jgi:hypothetical protein
MSSVPNTDRSAKLSENFYLYEFDCRDGTPIPDALVPDLKTFVQKNIQPLRDFFGAPIRILSGYRHAEYNKRINGSKRSYHIYDLRPGKYAVDIAVQGVKPVYVFQAIEGLVRSRTVRWTIRNKVKRRGIVGSEGRWWSKLGLDGGSSSKYFLWSVRVAY